MPRSKRTLAMVVGVLVAGILALLGPELYAQGRMVTTTGVVFVRGIIGSIPITVANIVTTSTDGLLLQNTTESTVGVPVQYSPRLRLCGTAWKTDATTASQTDCDLIELRPASAAGATTSSLAWAASINGGAYSDVMTLSSAGTLAPGAIATTGNINTAAAGNIYWLTRTAFGSPANGQLNLTLNDTSAGVGLDFVTDAVLKVRTRAQSAYATIDVLGVRTNGANVLRSTVPTVTGGGSTCGTSAPVIVGTDSAGKVTTGSVLPTVCVVTFSSAWTNAPACSVANETTSNLLRATSTTTTLTLTGTMVAADVLAYHCLGY